MKPEQRGAFERELSVAQDRINDGDVEAGLRHLERAHVIGQKYVLPHVRSHWAMLKLEWRRRRPAAVVGQAVRIVLGGIGSAVGVLPDGNTGGSNVSMFKRMPVDPQLLDIIEGRDAEHRDAGSSEDKP